MLGFTDHDRPLTFGGTTYESVDGFSPTEMVSSLSLSVDNMDVFGILDSGQITSDDLIAGRYDNAKIDIYRINWQDSNQQVLMHSGILGEIKRSGISFEAEIRSLSHQLNQPTGRLFQYPCDAILGDQRCAIDLNNPIFNIAAEVAIVHAAHHFTTQGLSSFESSWFSHGTLKWTTGNNTGHTNQIHIHRKQNSDDVIELWDTPPFNIVAADQFTIFAGCDKRFSTCVEKFFNQQNYRGFPHMPGNDYAISHPSNTAGNNTGGSRNQS